MSEVEEVSEAIRDIFCKYKEKQKTDLFRTLGTVKCCECGHKSRVRNVQAKLVWYRKMTHLYQFILGILFLLILCALYTFFAARRYNHARIFGNGACLSTLFWTCDDCYVSY